MAIKKSKTEKDIIKATKEFAKANDIPFNKGVEYMLLNAMREVKECIDNKTYRK